MAQRIVGLDIGTSAVRAVELTVAEGARPVLEAFGQVGLPHGAIVDGEVKETSGVAQALRRLWQEGGFREKRVRIGVAGLRAITRELDMPSVPPEELDDAVRFRADDVVQFPMDRTAVSARVIAEYEDAEGAATIRVLVAAAHLNLINSLVAAVEGAGLQPVAIDLNTAALVRAIASEEATSEGGPEAIVSVGAGLTLVVVHQGGILQFVRTIDLGGDSITRSIASALDLPEPDAEAVKRRLGTGASLDQRISSATAQAVTELVDEIHNSVRFFSSQPGRAPVGRLLVTGGGAQTAGFLAELQRRSSVPVVAASPLSMTDTRGLPITPEQAATIDPTLSVPIGLALPDRSGHSFNLLPPDVMQRSAEQRARRGFLVGAGTAIILVGGLTAWRLVAVDSAKGQVNKLKTSIAQIQSVQIPKYDKAVALKTEVTAEEKEPIPLVSNEVDWLVVLNQLSQFQPTDAVVADVTLDAVPPTSAPTGASGTASTTGVSAPSATATIGTLTTTVTVPNLTSVTSWGQAMNSGVVLTDVLPSGSLSPQSTGVTFSATMSISGNARSQRLDQFEEPLP